MEPFIYTFFFSLFRRKSVIFFSTQIEFFFRNRNWPPIFVGIWNFVFKRGILTGIFLGFRFGFWFCSRLQLQMHYVTALCGFHAVPTKSIYSVYKYKLNFHDLIQSIFQMLSNVLIFVKMYLIIWNIFYFKVQVWNFRK